MASQSLRREKNMGSTGFSWADEVEKEEQLLKNHQKPNIKPDPFGSARPREVVLEEKGVDWRKLDHQLNRPSNLRKEKVKVDLRTTAAIVDRREPFLQRHKGNVRDRIGPLTGLPNPQNHNEVADVPPFKHLPKNAMHLLGEMQRPCFKRFDVGLGPYLEVGFHETQVHEVDREWSREDMDYERVRAKYNLNTREDSRRNHMEKRRSELKFEGWEENMGFACGRDFVGDKGVLDRRLVPVVNGRIRAHGNMDMRRESFEEDYSERRVSLTGKDGDCHRRDHQRERRKFEAEELGGRAQYNLRIDKANFGRNLSFERNYNERRVGLTGEEVDWDDRGYRCDKRNFEAEEVRGRSQYDLKIRKVDAGGNFRKRSLSSAPGPSHYNGRRRR